MRISRKNIIKIIKEERDRIISEGCGCGCNGSPGGCGDSMDYEYPEQLDNFIDEDETLYTDTLLAPEEDTLNATTEFLTKDEALKYVMVIALSTSCPETRESLLGAVQGLMD